MRSSPLWRTIGHLRRTLLRSFRHDVFTSAKATAYSAILSLIPALLVMTTLLSYSHKTDKVSSEVRYAFGRVLPPDTMALARTYSLTYHAWSLRLLLPSFVVAATAAIGVMLSLMEGFRRAYRLPRHLWGFWQSRAIAIALIPICLVPMVIASGFIVFGHLIEVWMISNAKHELQSYVLLLWRLLRWAMALSTGTSVLTIVYHNGTPKKQHWSRCLPGAVFSTVTWFLITLAYGWYVTRFAVYMVSYGSLAAVIATLVWLYITSLSILLGAELNAEVYPKQRHFAVRERPSGFLRLSKSR